MPVIARIDWICSQLHMGRRVHVSYGAAQDPTVVKVKITLASPASGEASPVLKVLMGSTLLHLRELVSANVAVDRGHRHSNGSAIVSIWIRLDANTVMGTARHAPTSSPLLNPVNNGYGVTSETRVSADRSESIERQSTGRRFATH